MKAIIFSLLAVVMLAGCSNFGKKVKSGNIVVYYKTGIDESQAKKAADLFNLAVQQTNPNATGEKAFQLSKPSDTVLLKMSVDKSKMDKIGEGSYYAIITLVSDSVFNGAPVNLSLTDNRFNPIRSFAFKKQEKQAEGYGEKVRSGNIEVYAANGIGTQTANDLASFLDKFMQSATPISFQISKNENNDFAVKMVSDPAKINSVTNEMMSEISTKISNEVLHGSPVLFQLTDEKFNPLKTFAYPSDAATPDSTVNHQ